MMTTKQENDFKCLQENPDDEHFLDEIYDFANTEKEPPKLRRKECERCRRPATVCWCPFLPDEKIKISTNVFILQHPFEELRKLKTAPMLCQSLQEEKCHIIRGKKFGSKRNVKYPELDHILQSPQTLLLFPGDDALDIVDLPPLANGVPYNLFVLDGTWTQAKGMYVNNHLLKVPKKVMINCDMRSRYVIRTQPTDSSLSTLESVAVALSILERKPQLIDLLLAPLEALCKFQLNYGAVQHQSKEYKINNGLCKKTLPRKMLKRMEKEKCAAHSLVNETAWKEDSDDIHSASKTTKVSGDVVEIMDVPQDSLQNGASNMAEWDDLLVAHTGEHRDDPDKLENNISAHVLRNSHDKLGLGKQQLANAEKQLGLGKQQLELGREQLGLNKEQLKNAQDQLEFNKGQVGVAKVINGIVNNACGIDKEKLGIFNSEIKGLKSGANTSVKLVKESDNTFADH